jgi:amino acid transporter
MSLARLLLGRPLATEEAPSEAVGVLGGVAILGLDALASAAYGPEALLTVLIVLGTRGLPYVGLITAAIIVLLALLYLSYRQTIRAYPNGGGAYVVAKENLGRGPSLLAAAALALDYLLNVAVAISAGVGALVSAVPPLLPYTLPLALVVLAVLTVVNLRGVRATGNAFLAPTWVFVGTLALVIGMGLVRTFVSDGAPTPVVSSHAPRAAEAAVTLWLLLRAFANGCTAMTGVEAVSNGTPIFRAPTAVNASRALTLIIVILAALLAGEAVLCGSYQITATPPGEPGYQSVISQIVAAVVGRGLAYDVTLASVVVALALSANTSFAGFPRLCRVLAADRFLPEPFLHRGRRLAFSWGILVLAVLSALLLVVFRGITDRLIPLFAIGAFLAFTISQAGMVVHWKRRLGERGARAKLAMNALGASATLGTLVIVFVSKLQQGAWISGALVALTVLLFSQVRRHYAFVARATAMPALTLGVAPFQPPIAVVPLREWNALAIKALRFALGASPDVIVVQVLTDERQTDDLTSRWDELAGKPARDLGARPPRLVVLRSEYRRLFEPLLAFLSALCVEHPDRQIAAVLPELVEPRWYHYLLHAHTAAVMRAMLLARGGPQLVVIDIPWHLEEWIPERWRLVRETRARGPAVASPARG